jgi:hypothetical protein
VRGFVLFYYHYFLRFRVPFNFLGAFLAFSSFGAGSGKRTQKAFGAHQEKIFIAVKENMAIRDFQRNYVSYIWKFNIVRSLYINALFFIISAVSLLSFFNSLLHSEKQEEFSPK